MNNSQTKILLIGAGKMGGALLAAWRHKLAPSITVLEKDAVQTQKFEGAKVIASLDEATDEFDVIVLAVKPQSMDEVLSPFRQRPQSHTLYLSIAAGKTLSYFEKHLGDAPVVRAMPNTPALIGKGISALVANAQVSKEQKELATTLLGAAGKTVWLDDESQMDAVTALSGSGPAYVFLFLEALVAAGMKQGLPEETAHQLALQTMRGSVKLAQKSDEPLAQLRRNVTSPGGTTEAALKVLMKSERITKLIDEAVASAVKRSKELA